ncbi:MAG: type IV secretory system conjugative DNA transfer family protein [Gammaproteobacteria bacterium]
MNLEPPPFAPPQATPKTIFAPEAYERPLSEARFLDAFQWSDFMAYLESAGPVEILILAFLGNLGLRTAVFLSLRFIGAYDPRMYHYWPTLPWRPFMRLYGLFREWWEINITTGKESTEGFSSVLMTLATPFKPGTFLLGLVRFRYIGGWLQPVGQKITRHCLLIAATRSGKSVFLATILALLPRRATALLIDPKGFFSRVILQSMKRRNRNVHALDPLAISGMESSSINLLSQIPELNRRIGQDVSTIVFDSFASADLPKIETKNPFFSDTARALWAALMAHVASTIPDGSMVDARRLLTQGYIERANDSAELAMAMLWQAMAANPSWNGYIGRVGLQMIGMAERTRNDVLATARSATKYLDHAQVQAVSQRTDFFLTDLKREDSDLVVSIALPTTAIREEFNPWVTQIVGFTLKAFELIEGNLSEPCRLILEELPAYGPKMPGLVEAFPLLRGYGAIAIGVCVDLDLLFKKFPDDARTMLGNSDFTFFMGVKESHTKNYITNEVLGKRTHKKKNKNGTVQETDRAIMTSGQVERFLNPKRNNVIVDRAGARPLRLKIARYFTEIPVWLCEADKEFGEPAPRAAFRRFFNRWIAPLLWPAQPQPAVQPPRRAIAGPDISGATEAPMSIRRARQILGLSGSFTAVDIQQRAAFARRHFPPAAVEDAVQVLQHLAQRPDRAA